ncbi:MAG: SO2930 family diheme c-type cytochrome [Pontixanthobacter sp.]
MKRILLLVAALLSVSAALANPRISQVNDAVVLSDTLPRNLDDYGFFADVPRQLPAASVYAYELNTPLFSDGASKDRFVYVPQGKMAKSKGEGLIEFPVGSALIKTFSFGEGANRRMIETRVLLHRETGWLALPYRWNEGQTEATLAVAGARLDVTNAKGEAFNYRIPNKNQCKECHGLSGAVTPIGPKARNLSHEWLEGMTAEGKMNKIPDNADIFTQWAERGNARTTDAARAYLDVNCAHCHQPGATASNSGLDLRWEQDEPQKFGIAKRPVAAGRGSGGLLFDIVPGKPDESILLHRMNSDEPGIAMPELGKTTVDDDGTGIVRRWIAEMQ